MPQSSLQHVSPNCKSIYPLLVFHKFSWMKTNPSFLIYEWVARTFSVFTMFVYLYVAASGENFSTHFAFDRLLVGCVMVLVLVLMTGPCHPALQPPLHGTSISQAHRDVTMTYPGPEHNIRYSGICVGGLGNTPWELWACVGGGEYYGACKHKAWELC